jgi:hypothetical protein
MSAPPSKTIFSSPRAANGAKVARSVSVYAAIVSAIRSVAPMPLPATTTRSERGAMPALSHNSRSRSCVPDESPREMKRAPDWAIRRIASAATVAFPTCAGSAGGPTMTKSLNMIFR